MRESPYLELLNKLESMECLPSKDELNQMGKELPIIAQTREGYSGLAWKIGVYLMVYTSEHADFGADTFYERYGIDSVAAALKASLEARDFPLGLSFITHDFLPSGGIRDLTSAKPIIDIFNTINPECLKIRVKNFQNVSPDLRRATALFLDEGEGFSVPQYCRLQMSAALILATPSKSYERQLVTKSFLNALNSGRQPINLFYCWRAVIEEFPELLYEPEYLNALPAVIKYCRESGSDGVSALCGILDDKQFLGLISNSFEIRMLLGLAGWWLFVNHNKGQGLDLAWQLIFELSDMYKNLSQSLKDYLQIGQGGLPPEKIESLQVEFQTAMRELRQDSRLRSYRGVPLALQIQRYNLVNILEPIYEAIEGSSALPNSIKHKIQSLDPLSMVDENPLQKDDRRPIVGELRMQIITDYESIIGKLNKALELRILLDKDVQNDSNVQLPLSSRAVRLEMNEIATRYPMLNWVLEWFLSEDSIRVPAEG